MAKMSCSHTIRFTEEEEKMLDMLRSKGISLIRVVRDGLYQAYDNETLKEQGK